MKPTAETPLKDLNVEFGERPLAPDFPQATQAHREQGRTLAYIHAHHLAELSRIAKIMEQIQAGLADADALVNTIADLELTGNLRGFGTICGRECSFLTFHHDAEERMIFPQLAAQHNPALSALVDRLQAEHLVVHELLERLDGAARTLRATPDADQFAQVSAIFRQLVKVVESHFGYEETQLEAALGLYVPVI